NVFWEIWFYVGIMRTAITSFSEECNHFKHRLDINEDLEEESIPLVELLRRACAKGADVCTAEEYSNPDDRVETSQVASDCDIIDAIKESKSLQTSSNDDDIDEENSTVIYAAAIAVV
ncbi:hypothetical protein CAPTEDRAFT_203045, partial [Capitella teleta]